MRVRTLALLVTALTLVLLMAPTADAKRVKTRVILDPFRNTPPSGETTYFFAGQVKSKTHTRKCENRRKVQVFRDEPTGEDTFIGKGRTDPFGTFIAAYETDLDEVPGTYYAKVSKKEAKRKGRKLLCARDRSPPVTVDVVDL